MEEEIDLIKKMAANALQTAKKIYKIQEKTNPLATQEYIIKGKWYGHFPSKDEYDVNLLNPLDQDLSVAMVALERYMSEMYTDLLQGEASDKYDIPIVKVIKRSYKD